MLLLTVVLLIVLFLVSYKIFDRDLFAPPTVVCISFLFSSLCTLYNETAWGLDFSFETTLVMLTGIGTFLLGGIIGVFLSNGRNMNRFSFSHQVYPAQFIEIGKVKLLAVIAFQVIVLFWLYRSMTQSVGFIGVSWSDIMHIYRFQSMHLNPEEMTMRLPYLLRQFLQLSFCFASIFSYIVGNNLAAKKKFSFLYWIPIVLGAMDILMQGYRGAVLRLWAILVVVWYTIQKRSSGWQYSKDTIKMIRKMAVLVLVVLFLFSATRSFVGRRDSSSSVLDYVTFYGGCSIAAFDMFIKEPNNDNSDNIWGKETFYYLNQNIAAWLGKEEYRSSISEKGFQISPNGTYVGNVYTALRHPIADFGYLGLPVVMSVMGCFFTFFYCKTRNKHGDGKVDFLLLAYSCCTSTIFLYFFSAYYFFVSTTFIKTLILWRISLWLLMRNFNITTGKRRT